MVTIEHTSDINSGTGWEYRGLSEDTKPVDCPNGSVFVEMDTGKIWMYDGANSVWYEI